MTNSDYMAEAMRRESEREILNDLKAVLEKHDLAFIVTDYGDQLQIVQSGRYVIKTIHTGVLNTGNITND